MLSQWRGYGARDGIAIVFDTQRLFLWAAEAERKFAYAFFALSEVFYDKGQSIFERQFPILIEQFKRFALTMLDGDILGALRIEAELGKEFVANICRYKYRAFQEEREVRLVCTPWSPIKTDKTIVAQKQILEFEPDHRRHIEIGSREVPSILPTMRRIIVGPSKVQDQLVARIRQLVGDGIEIKKSETPLIR